MTPSSDVCHDGCPSIGRPSKDRLEILKIHRRYENLDQNVSLPDLAKKTPFYSGSDLNKVAVAAALNAVREENGTAVKFRPENPNSEAPYPVP